MVTNVTKVLVVGRHPDIMARVLDKFDDRGIPTQGVFDDSDAMAAMLTGEYSHIVVGGGVEAESKEALREEADQLHMACIFVSGPGHIGEVIDSIMQTAA